MTVMWAERRLEKGHQSGFGVDRWFAQGVALCDQCKKASVGYSHSPGDISKNSTDYLSDASDESIIWFPKTGSSPEFPDVPLHIVAAAKEAHSALSIDAVMAAILMARTVVEATAKEKGIVDGVLVVKIDALAEQNFIRESTKDAAHEIRHFGNDMAHGDIHDVPSSEDAQEVLTLMDEVLNEVFQGPARTARVKARRAAPITE